MSILFTSEGQEIWWPANFTGNMYLMQLHALEKDVGGWSGLYYKEPDWIEIDKNRFRQFMDVLLKFFEKIHSSTYLMLTEGCLAISLAIYAKLFGERPTVPDHLARAGEVAAALTL